MKDSDEIVNELLEYLQEDDSHIFKNMLSEEELDVIEQVYFLDRGYHILWRDYEGETQEEQDEKREEDYK